MERKVIFRFALLLSALVLASGTVCAQNKQSSTSLLQHPGSSGATTTKSLAEIPISDIPYTKFVLRNGLTLLVHEDHKAPIVAVNTWYHVGSKNEQPGKTGFAHLFEHLMFSGSENFNHNYLEAMQKIGATDLNGSTNNDYTNYFENVPTSMLDYVLFAESDRMGHFLEALDQRKLDLQRGVVQNEKRSGENQPYGVTRQLLTENTYPPGHPYSWTVIGSMKDLDAASLTDVQDWFKTYYGPNNVTLVIAGDITPEVARKKVEKYYGEIPPGPPLSRDAVWIPRRTGTHRGSVQDRVPQARIYRVWNVPQSGSSAEALLDLAAQVLGTGKTSRLYKRLVYRDQTATAVSVFQEKYEIASNFTMILTAKPDTDVRKIEFAAEEELRNFLKNGPSEAELQIAKTQILVRYAHNVERIGGFGGKSDVLARCQTFEGNPECYKTYLNRVSTATPASVRKTAEEWLSDGDYLLEVLPFPTDLGVSAKLDRSKEPELGDPMSLNLPPMQKATLSNGLKVVLAERPNAPLTNFSLLVNSGYSADPAAAAGTASLTQQMLEEGTTTRDSFRIAEELESMGANFAARANLDWATVSLNVLKNEMDKSLEIYADLILHPVFPQKEFERLQKTRLAAIKSEKVQPQSMALRVVPRLLYGDGHPYALPFTGSGTEASVRRLTRQDLARFHDTWFKPNNATLLVVGDITMSEIKPKLERLFASWKPDGVPQKNTAVAPKPGKETVYLIDRPGSEQSVIFAAQLVPPPNDPDAIALELVNDVFGHTFSSRINMNLRENKHWSYGASSTLSKAVGLRPFLSVSAVQTDKTKESLAELVKEYRNIISNKPISPEELKGVQKNETLGLPGSFETVQQLASAYSEILEYNLPEDYYNTYTHHVLAVDAQTANKVARQFIQPDHLVWVVVGDMSQIEAGIRSLDIGEVRKIDSDGNPVN